MLMGLWGLNGFWKKSDGCRALRKSFLHDSLRRPALSLPGRETLKFKSFSCFLCSSGAGMFIVHFLNAVMAVELSRSSPLKK